ncbi:Glucose/ribitol dehydrogenase [Penicillium digitatum]|uniref:Glucose/ribitol dehydrogenase n=1 Tax=Penicillium digitatum TaxID=36651 RepID=A0A7T6XT88_PENDI|nr:Glucose/ribitol dehydrogenase [Penicillium digitatum]
MCTAQSRSAVSLGDPRAERLQKTLPLLQAGQVAIITGAGQGIGAEAARLFANEGAKVVVADIDAEKANAVADTINSAKADRALAVVGDVLDGNYITELVKKTAEFGNDKQWETMLAVHNTAPFQLVRAAAPYFRVKDQEPRVVINISSTSGIHGNAGQANYAVAKAGVVGLTRTIAKEWGPAFGVRANTIAFGFVTTRLTAAKEEGAFVTMPDGTKVALGIPGKQLATKKGENEEVATPTYPDIPLRRPATPVEAARAILGVASPWFSYVNGETIRVTGGRNM